jgi:predicted ArsR family transcriptional regulator
MANQTQKIMREGLKKIRKGSKFTAGQLAEETLLSTATIRKHLPTLIGEGLVEVISPPGPGAGKQGVYRRVG